ncbi:MAG: carboxy-S-adenosyl-L-methionine synthase CmoA [Gammaproteobacteria bacterium]|nr:carboxy-S-adenosyl-L-methionine synthase CmoA [Gammaproteobacteria bacterium]
MSKDEIYKQPLQNIEDFSFDKAVSDAFDDMVDRSVPGYRTLIANIGPISAYFLRPNTHCYDLGCSHGAASLSIFNCLPYNSITIHAIDNSSAMIHQCEQLVSHAGASDHINTLLADINNISIQNASVVVLNLTLQFLPLDQRYELLSKIVTGMNPGGACILTEKIILQDHYTEDLFHKLHTNFKSANQYSQLEISQKRKAIENVLIRESFDDHQQRLFDVGFSSVTAWFQCLNFASLIAVK